MDIRPIKSEGDYKRALRAIEQLWEAKPETPESDRLELLSILVEAFEREHYPIPPPDPIAAIEHCMESRGLTRKDLESFIGSRARVRCAGQQNAVFRHFALHSLKSAD